MKYIPAEKKLGKEQPEVEPQPRFPNEKSIVDKVFGAGNLESWEYDEAKVLVSLAKEEVVKQILENTGILPYKDGDAWCILKGDNLQVGYCGFGDTIEDALIAFLKDIPSQQDYKPKNHKHDGVKECSECAKYWIDFGARKIKQQLKKEDEK